MKAIPEGSSQLTAVSTDTSDIITLEKSVSPMEQEGETDKHPKNLKSDMQRSKSIREPDQILGGLKALHRQD